MRQKTTEKKEKHQIWFSFSYVLFQHGIRCSSQCWAVLGCACSVLEFCIALNMFGWKGEVQLLQSQSFHSLCAHLDRLHHTLLGCVCAGFPCLACEVWKKKVAVWSMSQFLEVWKCSQWRNIKRWRLGMECLALVLIRNILFITHMWDKKGRISITTVHWKRKYLYYSDQF